MQGKQPIRIMVQIGFFFFFFFFFFLVNSKSSVINVSVQVWSKSIHLFKDIAVDLRDVGLEN